jgi:hypothetical protein
MLEMRGIRTVTLCTDAFEGLAREVVIAKDMPSLMESGVIITPHPIVDLSEDELEARADAMIGQVVELLNVERR